MTNIEILSSTKRNDGWSYQVRLDNSGVQNQYSVTLSQSDYGQWSQHQVPPEQVIRKAFEFLLERESAASILSSFDCSVIRRYFPEVDRELPTKL